MTIEVRSALLAARGRASELLRSTDGPWPHTRNHQSRDSPLSATTSASCSTFARRPQLYLNRKAHERGRSKQPAPRVPLDTLMKEFASMATPKIMVDEKASSHMRSSARPAGPVRIATAR